MNIKMSAAEKIGYSILIGILLVICFITLYPMLYVISNSISDVLLVTQRKIVFFPKGISLDAYKMILEKETVWTAYYNTLWYTFVGTTINVVLTIMVAYPLSRKTFGLRKPLMFFIAFTMWFNGGLIPNFLVIKQLDLYNNRWVMVLPMAITAMNVIITRTFMQQSVPEEFIESAKIDGANDITILLHLVIPVSKAIIAVNVLFYGVAHWNQFFHALIYLPDEKLQPMQLYLRDLLIENQSASDYASDDVKSALIEQKLRYAIIVFAMLPITILYPFLQKYFVKGVMIGSLKG